MRTLDSVGPALRRPSRDELYQIFKWFACYVLCSLLPLWGGYGLSNLLGHNANIGDYVGRGEFFLYTASLIGATLFLVLRDFAPSFPFRGGILLASIFLLVLAVLFFGGVFTSRHQPLAPGATAVSISFLAWTSLMVYAVSLAIAIFAQYVDIIANSYDPRRSQAKDATILAQQLHALED